MENNGYLQHQFDYSLFLISQVIFYSIKMSEKYRPKDFPTVLKCLVLFNQQSKTERSILRSMQQRKAANLQARKVGTRE